MRLMKYICKTFGLFFVSVFDVINFSEIWRTTGLKYGFIKVLPNHNLKFRKKLLHWFWHFVLQAEPKIVEINIFTWQRPICSKMRTMTMYWSFKQTLPIRAVITDSYCGNINLVPTSMLDKMYLLSICLVAFALISVRALTKCQNDRTYFPKFFR